MLSPLTNGHDVADYKGCNDHDEVYGLPCYKVTTRAFYTERMGGVRNVNVIFHAFPTKPTVQRIFMTVRESTRSGCN
ncbi:hypothetical protein [uncultured Corynebacterium sp.]|uniref:hypothetical protein n=1 Tax=uncultured Corynebacterium sp. TaxID=159447 RepID=UPI0025CC330D|nr:hypothetical protein [uncultured Corynebacterium sp.]